MHIVQVHVNVKTLCVHPGMHRVTNPVLHVCFMVPTMPYSIQKRIHWATIQAGNHGNIVHSAVRYNFA